MTTRRFSGSGARIVGVSAAIISIAAGVNLGSGSPAHASGTLDPTFGTDGVTTVRFSSTFNSFASGIALDSKQRIVTTGWTREFPSTVSVVRLSSSGQPDTTFGTGGQTRITVSDQGRRFGVTAAAVAIDSRDRIVIAGTTDGMQARLAVIRINRDGKLDRSFGPAGTGQVLLAKGTFAGSGQSVQILRDDTVVLAGGKRTTIDRCFIAELNSRGNPVRQFGVGGARTYSEGRSCQLSAITYRSGKLVGVGTVQGDVSKAVVLRVDSRSGARDRTFGSSGVKSLARANSVLAGTALSHTASGQLLVLSTRTQPSIDFPSFTVTRLMANGRFDRRFGSRGWISSSTTDPSSVGVIPTRVLPMNRSSAFTVVGTRSGYSSDAAIVMAQYRALGSPDPTFGAGGWSTVRLRSAGSSSFAAIAKGSRIWTAGFAVDNPTDPFAIAKFTR